VLFLDSIVASMFASEVVLNIVLSGFKISREVVPDRIGYNCIEVLLYPPIYKFLVITVVAPDSSPSRTSLSGLVNLNRVV